MNRACSRIRCFFAQVGGDDAGFGKLKRQRQGDGAAAGAEIGQRRCGEAFQAQQRPFHQQFGVRPRIGFAPVRIAPEATPAGVADRGTIEIEFATGARMRITGAVDTAALTAAVAVLAEGRRR